jgi:putative sterol carrier protein
MSLTIATIMQEMPGALMTEKALGVDAVVHFKFSGTEAGEWNAVIRDGACTVAQGLPKSRPTITLTADSSDFIRVVTGEVQPAQAVMDGRLKVGGDLLLAPRLLQLFQLR